MEAYFIVFLSHSQYEVHQSSLFNKPENLSCALSVCKKLCNENSANQLTQSIEQEHTN